MRKKQFMALMNTKLSTLMGEVFYDTFATAINKKYATEKESQAFTEVADKYMEVWASIVNHSANNYYDLFGEESVNEAIKNSDLNNVMFTLLASVAEIFLDFGELINSQHETIMLLDGKLRQITDGEILMDEFNDKMSQIEFDEFQEKGTEFID